MLYETDADRIIQSHVVGILREHIGERYLIVETDGICPYDFEVWANERVVAIGEIKCRKYAAEFFENQGYLISLQKLKSLGAMLDSGVDALLVVRTSEHRVFYIKIKDARKAFIEGRVAQSPDYMTTKTDHGNRTRQQPDDCYILPSDLFVWVA